MPARTRSAGADQGLNGLALLDSALNVGGYIPVTGADNGADACCIKPIYIIVLQQLANNLIYPKVVGKSVGMPSVLILIAIIAGAELGGAAGIMLGIPLLSAVYMLVKESIEEKA